MSSVAGLGRFPGGWGVGVLTGGRKEGRIEEGKKEECKELMYHHLCSHRESLYTPFAPSSIIPSFLLPLSPPCLSPRFLFSKTSIHSLSPIYSKIFHSSNLSVDVSLNSPHALFLMLVPGQLPSQDPRCFCCQTVSMIRNAKVLEDQTGQFQGRKRQFEMGVNLSFECSIDR